MGLWDHTALALVIIIDINSGERSWTLVICRPFQRQPWALSIRGASLFTPSGADALTSPGQDGKPDEGFSSADLSLQHGSPLPPTRSMINPTEHQRLLSPLTLSFISPFTLPPYLLPGHFVPVYFQICFPFLPRKSRYWVSVSSHYCLLTQPPCLSVRAHSYLCVVPLLPSDPSPPFTLTSPSLFSVFLFFPLVPVDSSLFWQQTLLFPTTIVLYATRNSLLTHQLLLGDEGWVSQLILVCFTFFLWLPRPMGKKYIANFKMSSRPILWPCALWECVCGCLAW